MCFSYTSTVSSTSVDLIFTVDDASADPLTGDYDGSACESNAASWVGTFSIGSPM